MFLEVVKVSEECAFWAQAPHFLKILFNLSKNYRKVNIFLLPRLLAWQFVHSMGLGTKRLI